jgi:hypothetical protein
MKSRAKFISMMGLMSPLFSQSDIQPVFAAENVAPYVRDFAAVCPVAIFENAKLDDLLRERGYTEVARNGDPDTEIVSFENPQASIVFEFRGSPKEERHKEIWHCSLFLQEPTPIPHLAAALDHLTRDPRLSSMQKSSPRSVSGMSDLAAKQTVNKGCLHSRLMSFDTPHQKTTQLILGHSTTKCEDVR